MLFWVNVMAAKTLEINSKEIHLMKPLTGARYDERTVLTNSSWEFVSLWLRRQPGSRAERALFYWKQAKSFYDASGLLPIESKPLTAYYCCMNAAKALLAIKGPSTIDFDGKFSHGISSNRKQWGKSTNLKNAEVIFNGSGVLFELSKHFNEEACKKSYTIYDLLYNIPCIHRAFSTTYQCAELFVPIRDVKFTVDIGIRKGWVQFQVDKRYANGNSLRYVPSRYEKDVYNSDDNRYIMRSKQRFKWDIHEKKMQERMEILGDYHRKLRKDILYVSGDEKLWYIKKEIPNNKSIIQRNSITLIFAVMHWLSELVRYNPEKFDKLMDTKQNWIIHEFIETALYQYVDEISCEITGTDIMTPGYRK